MSILIHLIIIGVLILFILFIYIDFILFFKHKMKKKYKQIQSNIDNLSYFHIIISASYKMCKNKRVIMSYRKPEVFLTELKSKIIKIYNILKHNKQKDTWLYGWNKGFLYASLVDSCCTGEVDIQMVKQYFDQHYINEDGSIKFDFSTIHQTPFAKAALGLYQLTHEEKYKKFCDNVFNLLVEWQNKEGYLLYFREPTIYPFHFVDQLGMYIPFLMGYSQEFKHVQAYQIAKRNFDYFINHGISPSGLPFYLIIKDRGMGNNNWGRGCSWFILALLEFIDKEEKYYDIAFNLSSTLDDYSINNHLWSQFIGASTEIDSSVTIPILLLKYKLKQKLDYTSILKSFTNNIGQIMNSSGETYGMMRYSEVFGPSEFAQSMALLLMNNIIHEEKHIRF